MILAGLTKSTDHPSSVREAPVRAKKYAPSWGQSADILQEPQ